jgi:SNF2 family DNA or RNA helicase
MLPPRMEALLFCRPSREQKELYQAITHARQDMTAEALTKLLTLRKICTHPCLHDESSEKTIHSSGKLVVLDALLQSIRTHAPKDKVVIVSNFTSALSLVETLLLEPRQWNYSRLDGTTDVQSRQSLVDTFNTVSADKQFCFLLSSKAGGCGINLVGANRLIMLDADWNPATCVQAMGRVYRQGQTKPSFIYRLFTAGTVEEVIYQRQLQKGNLAQLAVDGGTGTGRFTKEELTDCFTLKDCACDTHHKVGTWVEYQGPETLKSQGCADLPLTSLAASDDGTLYIHIVTEDDEEALPAPKASSKTDETDDPESLYDSDDEAEFELE